MNWDARIKHEASGFQRRCSVSNEMLAVAAYLEGRTGEGITAPRRRPSLAMPSLCLRRRLHRLGGDPGPPRVASQRRLGKDFASA
jgi:hypothetical protein